MINISTNKQLNIIFANTNKALAEVVKKSSSKELEVLSKNKDLKSIMNSIFDKTTKSSADDKVLLELVKNNPTLKNLGNVSNTIKDLLNAIKSDKNQLPIEKTLNNFLLDIKDMGEDALKQKLQNSGVFLESKLKNLQNPQVELKTTLNSILNTLQNSKIFNAKQITQDIKNILATPILKDASNEALLKPAQQQMPQENKELKQLTKNIQNLMEKLQIHLEKTDPINTKDFTTKLEKVLHQTEPKLLTPENFKLESIVQNLTQLSTPLQQSQSTESKTIFDTLEKILNTLESIKKSSIQPKLQLDEFLDKKLPQDIKTLVQNIKTTIQKADPIFSKESLKFINKLQTLNAPEKLSAQHHTKEIISNDLKSVVLKATNELSNSSHPNQHEILKHLDKLSLQIDYQQLLSHLSNSSAIYLPFSWEQLEDGNINIKRDKKDKFYCDIDLKLKEYGQLTLKLVLYDKNQLNLHIYSDNNELKELVKTNIPTLRSALIDTQITPREIRIFQLTKSNPSKSYNTDTNPIEMGFEVKV